MGAAKGNKYRVLVTEIGTGRVITDSECKSVHGFCIIDNEEGVVNTFGATEGTSAIEILSALTANALDVLDAIANGDDVMKSMLIGLFKAGLDREENTNGVDG